MCLVLLGKKQARCLSSGSLQAGQGGRRAVMKSHTNAIKWRPCERYHVRGAHVGSGERSAVMVCQGRGGFLEASRVGSPRRAQGLKRPNQTKHYQKVRRQEVKFPATTDQLLRESHGYQFFTKDDRKLSCLCTLAHTAFCQKHKWEPNRHNIC